MRKALWWVSFLFLSAVVGMSQTGPDRVCEVNDTTPKPGADKQFEAARVKHNEFHKSEKDKWGIAIFQVTTGPATGDYLTVTCGMTWKDMDGHEDMDKRDGEDIAKTIAPATASNKASYYIFRPELSTGTEDTPIAKRMSVVHYFVKPEGISAFTDSIKRINEAIAKAKYPAKPTRWYSLSNGGIGPHFVAVTDRNSWADMQPPEQTMADMLKQTYGADDKTMQTLRQAVDHTVSELLEYRGDLSYIPAK